MRIGIIGLPSSGKTTFFNALTGQQAVTGSYSQSKEANRAVVKVPDQRLLRLAEIYKPAKITPAEVHYADIAGMTGAVSEQKKEAAYISNLRYVDALAQVVRLVEEGSIPHPDGTVNPNRDIINANAELVFNDLLLAENNVEKLEKRIRVAKSPESSKLLEILSRCREALEAEQFLADIGFTSEELKLIAGYAFLTLKPQLYILNIGENEIGRYQIPETLRRLLKPNNSVAVALCAKIAMEISRLDEKDRLEFRESLGIKKPALHTVIEESYRLLGLISFLTGGEKEVRAWTINRGATAQQAAGAIHTDLARGFIKAEIVHFDDLDRLGNWNTAKEKGKLQLEGKEYIVRDGDVILFRFNV